MIEAIVTIVVALCGAVIGWQGKKVKRLEERVAKLTREVEARYHQEQIACETLNSEVGTPVATLKILLRKEAEKRCGIYPSMTLGDLR